MAKIFISYRRTDAGQMVASIYNYVAEAFGPQNVFVDTKNIPDGQYFTLVIEHNIRDAAVMLVVIGKNWLATGSIGHRRVDEPGDLVRAEVRLGLELARQGRLTLIPVLVDDAAMPTAQELPGDLADLRLRNATQIHSSLIYLTDDMNRLLADIDRANIPRSKGGRIEQPPDRAVLLGGVFADLSEAGPTPNAPPHPAPATASPPAMSQTTPPAPPRPASPPSPPRPPAVRPGTTPTKPPSAWEVIVALLLSIPGLIRGLLVIGIIVAVVVAVMNLNQGLTEHSSCQQFEQASSDAQTKVIQQMMSAHHDNESIQTTRFSLNLYCNIEGPSAPIDGIYSG